MKKQKVLLIVLLAVIMTVTVALNFAEGFGLLDSRLSMLLSLPLAPVIVALCCILYAEEKTNEKGDS